MRGCSDREQHKRVDDTDTEDKQSSNVVLDAQFLHHRRLSVTDGQRHHDHFWQRSHLRSISGAFVGVLTFVCSSNNVFVRRCSLPIRLWGTPVYLTYVTLVFLRIFASFPSRVQHQAAPINNCVFTRPESRLITRKGRGHRFSQSDGGVSPGNLGGTRSQSSPANQRATAVGRRST